MDQDVSNAIALIDSPVMRSRVSLLYDVCREECGLARAMLNTLGAEEARQPLPEAEGEAEARDAYGSLTKRAKMSVYVDPIDDATFPLLTPLGFNDMIAKTKAVFACGLSHIEHLYTIYKDKFWSFIVEADETMRASRISQFWPAGDKTKWGEAFRRAATDFSFWAAEVDRRVFQVKQEETSGTMSRNDSDSPNQGGKSRASGSGKRAEHQFCFAYQSGSPGHAGETCPNGRKHLCMKCKRSHPLPRGNRECTAQASSSQEQSADGKSRSGGKKRVLSTALLPPASHVKFAEIRNGIERIVQPFLDDLSDVGKSPLPESMVDAVRDEIIKVCDGLPSAKDLLNCHSPLRGGLWKLLIDSAADWDTDIPDWLSGEGAPIGVLQSISPKNVFPVDDSDSPDPDTICLWELPGSVGPGTRSPMCDDEFLNYKSAEDRPEETMRLLRAEEAQGFCDIFQSREELVEALQSERFVVSRLALAPKPGGKFRLICDGTASGLNDVVRCSEKVRLPRISDAIEDALDLAGCDGSFDNLEYLSVDFRSAFKLVAVNKAEWCCQVCRFGKFYIKFNCLMFGTKSSPLVFCRVSACACRLAQLLYSSSMLRINCYIDDPIILVRADSPRVRKLRMLTVLSFWAAMGIVFSHEKCQRGSSVKWTGALFSLGRDALTISIPEDKIEAMGELGSSLLSQPARVDLKPLRKFCGKVCWASNIVPYLNAYLAPLWRRVGIASGCGRGSADLGSSRDSLKWLCYFFARAKLRCAAPGSNHCLSRSFRLSCRKPPRVSIVVDASTSGIGGVLFWGRGESATPVAYFGDALSKEDLQRFGGTLGSSSFQSCWELMAIVVALKLWQRRLLDCSAVAVFTDSLVSLRVAMKQKSRSESLNWLASRLALMCALDLRLLELRYKHIAGVDNMLADSLSRLQEGYAVPPGLASAVRVRCPPRGDEFWAL
ncbi:hypothetical protein FOZ62_020788 [Perkinsus olseni]|uniref:Reverse transcriptase domain-containing protein n=1 Tax=Perkinsus olseni TaxID=32597 RepID=A0A7J6R3E4_PEROL|nr:hypothetical protein FOZ62_020788 [Perkinsus olseni]